MVVLGEFGLVLNTWFNIALVLKYPIKNCFLNLLIIFFFKKFITKKLDWAKNKELSFFWTLVEASNRSVRWERDGSTWQKCIWRFPHIKCGSIWVYKLESAVLITIFEFIFGVSVFFWIFTRLISFFGLVAASSLYKLIVKTPVSNERLFRVKVLVKSLSNDSVGVDTDSHLL